MTSGVSVTAPIQPHEIPRSMREHLDDIVRRVVMASTVQGQGRDLMLRVYLAGMYHGARASSVAPHLVPDPTP